MKFTEEKFERAFTELLGQEGFSHHKPDKQKMSSFFTNKLDKYTIFVPALKQ